jgi:hypothetical protein
VGDCGQGKTVQPAQLSITASSSAMARGLLVLLATTVCTAEAPLNDCTPHGEGAEVGVLPRSMYDADGDVHTVT